MEAFTDTWQWDRAAEHAYDALITEAPNTVVSMIAALRQFIGANEMMAYLVMMTQRLIELHRVLKPTGCLYLHCDPTASHYLKIVLDTVFGKDLFRNEIIWQRADPKGHAFTRYPSTHDVLLSYVRSQRSTWHTQYRAYDPAYLASHYSTIEPGTGRQYTLSDCTNPNPDRPRLTYEWQGVVRVWRWTKAKMQDMHDAGRLVYTASGMPRYKRYLDEMPGSVVTTIWDDIPFINSQAHERLGYPTQKPLALLERIIRASSNPGDVVLDPFCGCGTAVVASEKLGRQWIGIDITYLAIGVMKSRLVESFPGIDFTVRGEPTDLGGARALAEQDRYQFQWWASDLVKAKPLEGKEKKGADHGIDGVINFVDDHTGKLKRCLVQVKSGHVSSATIRDLKGTIGGKAEMGVLVTLEPATGPMRKEAAEAGMYHSPGWGRDYPCIQILTIEALLAGAKLEMPPVRETFKRAEKISVRAAAQSPLFVRDSEEAALS